MTTQSPVPHRFRGVLVWADLPTGKREPRICRVERAILRPSQLVVEFQDGSEHYHVNLREEGDGVFRGIWKALQRGTERQNHVECKLKWRVDADDPADLMLRGKWLEQIDWRWLGLLDEVDSFTAPEAEE